jgi:hypothetical protein
MDLVYYIWYVVDITHLDIDQAATRLHQFNTVIPLPQELAKYPRDSQGLTMVTIHQSVASVTS